MFLRSLSSVALGAAAVALLAGCSTIGTIIASAEGGAPQETVFAFDQAWSDADCAGFQAVTTENFQETFFPTCEDFEAAATDFAARYPDYTMLLPDVTINDTTATIVSREEWSEDGQNYYTNYQYDLVKVGDEWFLDDMVELTEG